MLKIMAHFAPALNPALVAAAAAPAALVWVITELAVKP
jgi:hypothetical protein